MMNRSLPKSKSAATAILGLCLAALIAFIAFDEPFIGLLWEEGEMLVAGTERALHRKLDVAVEDEIYCQANNIVLERGDELDNHHKDVRPWSVSRYTFNDPQVNQHLKKCSNLDEYLTSIQNGTRRWVNQSHALLPPLEAEEYPSYFVPHSCYLPFLSSHQMCTTLNQFSHIILNGDSLSRHVTQGLFMILKRDLISGGIESTTKFGMGNPYSLCKCDGQFSENQQCRMNDALFYSFTPRDLELCSHLPEDNQFHFRHLPYNTEVSEHEQVLKELNCSDPQYKGALWVLQGGVHYGTNVERVMQSWIDPLFSIPSFKSCLEMKKIKVIWTSYGAQSRQLDQKYPLQTRENALIFNAAMEIELRKRVPDITIIDWWGVTREAQTSDGFHALSDVNLIKANMLANVVGYLPTTTSDEAMLDNTNGAIEQVPVEAE